MAMTDWIKCSDQLPPNDRLVTVFIMREYADGTKPSWTMKIDSRTDRDGGRWWLIEPYDFQPTHWMPLPEPPKDAP